MKKIVLSILLVTMTAIMAQAQDVQKNTSTTSPLLEQAGSFYFCGTMAMNKRELGDFLSTRCQPAYEKFQSGYKCYQAGWGLFGAGLAVDLVGSILWAFVPENTTGEMSGQMIAGASLIIAGGCAVIASLPTLLVGYARMEESVDIYNVSTRTASSTPAYWTVQGSENGIGVALNF